jgi:DNA-directed RNA polymerase sigma subunit (sigma70/sigma32)
MPFASLKRWVAGVCPKSQKTQKAFMLRMGMLKNVPMTFDEIGQELGGLSRERVRQIIDQAENMAKIRLHQKKLTPLIQRIVEILDTRGGKVKNTTMVGSGIL